MVMVWVILGRYRVILIVIIVLKAVLFDVLLSFLVDMIIYFRVIT